MTSNLDDIEQFLEVLKKKVRLSKKNLRLENNEYRTLTSFGAAICKNLEQLDKQLFVDLVTDFLDSPTVERADRFSSQFLGLYHTFEKQLHILEEQLLMSNNEKALAKCKDLLKSETKNVSIFSDAVENLWSCYEFYNPELSKEEDCYSDTQQLKEACEKFLDEVKNL